MQTRNDTQQQGYSRLFELAVHHLRDAIFVVTPDGDLLFTNPAVFPLLGYTPDEMVAGGLRLVWKHEDIRGVLTPPNDHRASSMHCQAKMCHKDGRLLSVSVDLARLPLDGSERILLVVREAESDREPTMHPPSADLTGEGAPVMVYVTNPTWKILWANTDKAIGSGYPIQELIGHPSPLRRYLGEEDPELLARIEKQLEDTGQWAGKLYSRRHNGEVYPVHATIAVVNELDPTRTYRLVMLTDLTAIRNTEELLQQMELYDPITRFPNRTLFAQEVSRLLANANPGIDKLYLLLVDVDRFSVVNESLGYETGDRVLRQLAERIKDSAGQATLFSRSTSDTFALVATKANSPTDVAAILTRITEALESPLEVAGHQVQLSASIGISSYPGDGETCDELLRAANVALQRAKGRGTHQHAYYHPGSEAISRRYVRLAPLLREGVRRGEFTTAFQPIVEVESGRVVSMEALARWFRPDGVAVSPADFIPVAEQSGAINTIFDTVLRLTCRHLRRLADSGYPGLSAAVNVSSPQCSDPHFADRVLSLVDEEGISHERLHLEITESLLMKDLEINAERLRAFQKAGMKVIIDDFGTGYSSFGYLKYLPVDGIKLDGIFARDVPGDETSEKLVSMILAMGRALDIPIVAEGVETTAQARFLRAHGCPRLQGFLISRPVPADAFVEFLRKGPFLPEIPES